MCSCVEGAGRFFYMLETRNAEFLKDGDEIEQFFKEGAYAASA